MSDDSSNAKRCVSPKQAPARFDAMDRGHQRWRQACNPLALSLIGLALAVALWGYGSKLALYFPPTDSTGPRVPVAKLWLEQRSSLGTFVSSVIVPKIKTRYFADAGGPALSSTSPVLFLHGVTGRQVLPVRPRLVPFFHAAIPLRSPPAKLFL